MEHGSGPAYSNDYNIGMSLRDHYYIELMKGLVHREGINSAKLQKDVVFTVAEDMAKDSLK